MRCDVYVREMERSRGKNKNVYKKSPSTAFVVYRRLRIAVASADDNYR